MSDTNVQNALDTAYTALQSALLALAQAQEAGRLVDARRQIDRATVLVSEAASAVTNAAYVLARG